MNQTTQEASTAAAAQKQQAAIPSWRWGIVWLMFLATMLNYMDRQTLQSTSQYIINEFSLDEEGYGWIEFWFSISYGCMMIPGGLLADRWNLRHLYVVTLLVWSAAGFMVGLADTVFMLSACRVILGIGEAFNWPCANVAVRRLMPLEARGLANGIWGSGASTGALVTPLIVLAIAGRQGTHWRVVFMVVGALGLAWAAMWYWSLRGTRAEAVSHARDHDGGQAQPGAFRAELRSLASVLSLRVFWITFVVSLTITVCWHFYRVWLPRYFKRDLGLVDDDAFQWSLVAFFVGADLGSIIGGYFTRRLHSAGFSVEGARKIVLLVAALLCLFSIPAVLVSNAWISVPLIVLVGVGALASFPISLAFTQEIYGKHTAALTGVFGTTGMLTIAVLAPVTGRFVDNIPVAAREHFGAFGLPLIAVSCLPLIGAIAAFWWPERKAVDGPV